MMRYNYFRPHESLDMKSPAEMFNNLSKLNWLRDIYLLTAQIYKIRVKFLFVYDEVVYIALIRRNVKRKKGNKNRNPNYK